ncbi:MAG TPA: FAD-dependent oxidoreductase [Clostridiales bacterium]|nr:FAD-dependent oxidoreductase [Clostridiales bacterium]
MTTDVLVIGGGPAGMAAALSARDNGADVVLIERDKRLGGILNQCIHPGFGLAVFGQELTGPEFAGRYIQRIRETDIKVMLGTIALSLSKDGTAVAQSEEGIQEIRAKAVVLATGCRERPRGAINIPGTRPAGVFSAGTAQKLINCCGYLPGKRAVILGSGDIGLIMARRLTLEGAKVEAVCEILPYSSGLKRNIVQCLDDFGIPLLLSHTVTRIFGKDRLSGVEISKVDESRKPIKGTERRIDCDLLLLSVGLKPEIELCVDAGIEIDPVTGGPYVDDRMETSAPGIFTCGNGLHVHDLADYAAEEGERAGKNAAEYAKSITKNSALAVKCYKVRAGRGVRSVVPQYVSSGEALISIRVSEPVNNAELLVLSGGDIIKRVKKLSFTPGEMVRIPVKGITSDVTVELKRKGVAAGG